MDRIDPRSQLPVNCINCRHMDADTLYTCAAYPDAIPVPILAGDIQHDQPLPGDNGIQFEAERVSIPKGDSDVIGLISDYYPDSVDALLGTPKTRKDALSGLFRTGYTVIEYRFDDANFSWKAWDKVRSRSFLQGYYKGDV